MNKLLFLLLFVCTTVFTGCKKDSITNSGTIEKNCWQLVDNTGLNIGKVCDKTESELKAYLKRNGGDSNNYTDCNYYLEAGSKSCYLIDSRLFRNLYASQAKLYARCLYKTTAVKIDCDSYCEDWLNREQRINLNPPYDTSYSTVVSKSYCGDTLTKIYAGYKIIKKNTADSLIYIQFSKNAVDWGE